LIRNERHALIIVGTSYKLAPAGAWGKVKEWAESKGIKINTSH